MKHEINGHIFQFISQTGKEKMYKCDRCLVRKYVHKRYGARLFLIEACRTHQCMGGEDKKAARSILQSIPEHQWKKKK